MSSVTAILVTYNSEGVVADALRSLVLDGVGEIIVVDNASADGTAGLISCDFPHVQLLRNETNEGFGRGNNRALEQVRTAYALLLNPDAVLEAGALAALLAAAERYPDAAILAPQLVDENGTAHVSYKNNVFMREKWIPGRCGAPPGIDGDICADYLSGAVWLVDMAHMKKTGFFDPAIFLYYEDDDLCMRSRAAGFSNVLVHDAKATHLQGASSGKPNLETEFFKQKHMVWSRIYLERKYHGEAAAHTLARKLRLEYSLKAALYALTLNKHKLARYRGRGAGTV